MRVRCNKADLVIRTRVASSGRGKNIPSLQALLYGCDWNLFNQNQAPFSFTQNSQQSPCAFKRNTSVVVYRNPRRSSKRPLILGRTRGVIEVNTSCGGHGSPRN